MVNTHAVFRFGVAQHLWAQVLWVQKVFRWRAKFGNSLLGPEGPGPGPRPRRHGHKVVRWEAKFGIPVLGFVEMGDDVGEK